MKRVEFTLSMPGCASWDGRWSGQDQRFAVVRTLTDQRASELMAGNAYWIHAWSDGWCAAVSARIMRPGERRKRSDGFSGYEWMVGNIIDHGTTYYANAAGRETVSVRHITKRAAELVCGRSPNGTEFSVCVCGYGKNEDDWVALGFSVDVTMAFDVEAHGITPATRPTCPACSVRLDEMLAAAGR